MREEISVYKLKYEKHLITLKDSFEKLSLSETIKKAAKAEDPTNGNKMFRHQRRVGSKKAEKGYDLLKLKETDLVNCKTFEDIMVLTDGVMKETKRLGPLWSYDTALRIGFHLKIYPTDVYIQAGVVKGYVKLYGKRPKSRKIPKNKFPMLAELEAYEIENFLCIWGGKKSNTIKC